MAFDDNRTTGSAANQAANKAIHGHDEPRTKGDAVGETVGGLSGAATGAALGSLGGPIGTIIGGIAGAVSGWWTGRAVSEAASSFDGDEDYYRSHYNSSTSSGVKGTLNEPLAANSGTAGLGHSSTANNINRDLSFDRARPAYQVGHLAGMNPDYTDRKFDDVEVDLRRGWDSHKADDHHSWDDVRDFARTGYERGRERRLTLHDEQLAVGKREVSAGEVQLRKTVETEHVTQHVPLRHDEVTIERHPITGASAMSAADMTIGEETIRVPLTAEEAVVEKRIVPTEEVVLRTEQVVEDRVVEGDVRHERLATEGLEGHTRGSMGAAGLTGGSTGSTSGRGLGERLADTLDDAKDRVDGNPASRPGIDRTDDLNRRI